MAADFVNIEDILDSIELQSDFGTHTESKKRYQLKDIALNGVRELDQGLNFNVISVDRQVNDDGTIDVPDDFLDYSMIFILGDSGELIPLTKNKSINISNDPIQDQDGIGILDEKGEQIYGSGVRTTLASTSLINDTTTGNGSLRNLNRIYGSPIYGAGGGRNSFGYYRYDVINHTIKLDLQENIKDVVLDYVSDSINNKYDVVVPAPLRETIVAYINWKVIQYKLNIPARTKESASRDYYRERRLAKRKMNKFRLEEWVSQSAKYQMQALKF